MKTVGIMMMASMAAQSADWESFRNLFSFSPILQISQKRKQVISMNIHVRARAGYCTAEINLLETNAVVLIQCSRILQ